MQTPKTIQPGLVKERSRAETPSALERLRYLCPTRYFRVYMFYDRVSRRTCWLPEGYNA